MKDFVAAFREIAPYLRHHRGRCHVVFFGGEAVEDPAFPRLMEDIALLHSLGLRLVLVHGARPQIDACLRARGIEPRYAQGLRVTDEKALTCVKEAAGRVRVEIEAQLSPARLRVRSGNFVTARPRGVVEGVDFQYTGEVRRIDGGAIRAALEEGALVLLSPLGYAFTGEAFNLHAEEVATTAAIALGADKLIFLGAWEGHPRELSLAQCLARLQGLEGEPRRLLEHAIEACRGGVARVHIVDRRQDGALFLELFTREGVGTLVQAEPFEPLRSASIEDIPGILALIAPLEEKGVLVGRTRERLEREIERFYVMERDGLIIATAALHPYPGSGMGELACLAVHPDYRGQGRGERLLEAVERKAREEGLLKLFVLTTRTAHWFQERGFVPASPDILPPERRLRYDERRRSKVFVKAL